MNAPPHARHSLKARITLVSLTIFVASIWALSLYTSRMLREDMKHLLDSHLQSSVSMLAAEIHRETNERIKWLESIGARITPAMLDNPAALQEFLAQRVVLPSLFNGGAIIYRADGTAIADSLPATGRIGVKYMDVDSIATVLKEGKSNFSTPVMGKKLGMPVFGMTAPIRDTDDKIVGAISGVTNLGLPNYLDKIQNNAFGKTGTYLLVAPKVRLIVTASDKARIMETLPAPGVSPMIDRYLQGYEGTDVIVNPRGVEVLTSTRTIPATGWYVAASLPTAEAFAPIHILQQRVLIATMLLTLLAGGLIWWLLRRQLTPMTAAAAMLSTMADSNQPSRALPIASNDEIGALVGGINHLLETLKQREELLRQSEAKYRAVFNQQFEFVAILDADGIVLDINQTALSRIGANREDFVGKLFWLSPSWCNLSEWHQIWPDRLRKARVSSESILTEDIYQLANGVTRVADAATTAIRDADGNFQFFLIEASDTTERKRSELALENSKKRAALRPARIGTRFLGLGHCDRQSRTERAVGGDAGLLI